MNKEAFFTNNKRLSPVAEANTGASAGNVVDSKSGFSCTKYQ
jgi:hypothetical protein